MDEKKLMRAKRLAGRPRRGTISIDEIIIRYLMDHKEATWGELKDAVSKFLPPNDSSLKLAIDRLTDDMKINQKARLKLEKSVRKKCETIYKLVKPLGAIYEDYCEKYPLYRWVDVRYGELEWSKTNEKQSDTNASGISIKVSDELIEKQGAAIALALQGLSIQILDAIKESYIYFPTSENSRRSFFEDCWDTYLGMMSVEISALATPNCGDTTKAIQIAKGALMTKDMYQFEKRE